MRLRLVHTLGCAALLTFGCLPLLADPLTDHFVFHYADQAHGTQDVTFDLAAYGTYPTNDPYDLNFFNVAGVVNGTPTTLDDVLVSSDQEGGGLSPEYKGFSPILYGPQLYNYAADPTQYTFLLGTFSVYDPFSDGMGTVTISQNAASITPEPSSLLLLCTGLVGLATCIRLRV